MADDQEFRMIISIILPEAITGKLDRHYEGIESDRVLIDGDGFNHGYILAVIDGANLSGLEDAGILLLRDVVESGHSVELIPSKAYGLKLEAKPQGVLPDDD